MSYTSGTRLGPYEILGQIGAGGMGEVYRARDTRLGREVAIKVLPAAVSADPERVKRFEKEARSASSLNHPNIVTIYDIGESLGSSFIAMEVVEGSTLRDVLAEGPVTTKRLLAIAAQVAGGLARAHSAGIVHRDLKPENLMVTKDGLVKILDFGLAKLTQPEDPSGATRSPTVSAGTEPGLVMGTIAYMSPEQAVGEPLDFRSDQFALGSILYEMATGRRAFARATGPETLAAIIREEPEPIATLLPGFPAPLSWTVERCLSKDPRGRYASTEDLARELETVREHLSQPISFRDLQRAEPPSRSRRLAPILIALFALAAALYAGRFLERTSSPPPPVFRQLTFGRSPLRAARFSPDGQTVVYSAGNNANVELFAVRAESPESRPFGFSGMDILSISPTGQMALSLNRFVEGAPNVLAEVSMNGGVPRQLFEGVQSADWSPDSRLAVSRRIGSRCLVEFPVGRRLYENRADINFMRVSPRGDRIAFMDHPFVDDDAGSVAVVDLSGRKTTLSKVWASEEGLAWSPRGDEVWFTATDFPENAVLRAVTLSGKLRVVYRAPGILKLHDVFRDGRTLLQSSARRWKIAGFGPDDPRVRDLSWLNWSQVAGLSADGRGLLFTVWGQAAKPAVAAVYFRRTDGSPPVRLGDGSALSLSPDGKWVLYLPDPASWDLGLLPTGPGEKRPISTEPIIASGYAGWLPDGKQILFVGAEPNHGDRCYVTDIRGGRPRPVTPEGVTGHVISPEGRSLLAQGPDGTFSIYSLEGMPTVAVPGLRKDDQPIQWSENGKMLYVRASNRLPARIERLDLDTGHRELWKELTPIESEGVFNIIGISITRDGRTCAYDYSRVLSDLYVVEGLK